MSKSIEERGRGGRIALAAATVLVMGLVSAATAGADDMKIVTPHFGYITNTYENQDQGIDLEDGGLFFH